MDSNKKKQNNYIWYFILTVLLIAITATAGIFVFSFYIDHFTTEQDASPYELYYVMIADDTNTSLWQSIYEGAYIAGLEEDIYVDLLNGSFDNNYSREDLMRIAISSEVDGIIVAADESDEMTELIHAATTEGIPVVTLYGDNTRSDRCSFVGIGSYDLGREYGRQVLEIAQTDTYENLSTVSKDHDRQMLANVQTSAAEQPISVMVLMNANAQDSGQNILCSGIQETIENEKQIGTEIEISLVSIDETNTFSVEESIRDIFMNEDLPDIIICLNELHTTCVYQAVVDYNKVGQVNILGYYDSDTILKAIDRNVIYATISINTGQMGRYCVKALTEYNTYGNTSQYFIADIALINKDNIDLYLGGDTEDEP